MSARAITKTSWFPAVLSFGTVIGAGLLIALLVRRGLINRFIVPLRSDILEALPRVIIEEHVLSRFLLTSAEALSASVLVTIFGVAGGVLLYQFRLLREATETWVAAIAAAPLVLI